MTILRRVRVLVVDDSAFARKVLRETLTASPEIEVVGTARDGLDALEKLRLLQPDVVTLDLVMPNLDGLGFMAALPEAPPPVIIVSSAGDQSELLIAALQMGAVGFVQKPTAQATDRLYDLGPSLTEAVLRAAATRPVRLEPPSPRPPPPELLHARRKIVVVGASTGGPQALTQLFTALPAGLPVAFAIVLHIPVGYTEAFAKRLDECSPLAISEATNGALMAHGSATVARAGMHLVIRRMGDVPQGYLEALPFDSPHRPSVDALFLSAAEAFGEDVLGVVLTGMGNDGLEGARAIHRAGGQVLTQSEDSCVVYGMPRAVVDAGLSAGSASIEDMAAKILAHL